MSQRQRRERIKQGSLVDSYLSPCHCEHTSNFLGYGLSQFGMRRAVFLAVRPVLDVQADELSEVIGEDDTPRENDDGAKGDIDV